MFQNGPSFYIILLLVYGEMIKFLTLSIRGLTDKKQLKLTHKQKPNLTLLCNHPNQYLLTRFFL